MTINEIIRLAVAHPEIRAIRLTIEAYAKVQEEFRFWSPLLSLEAMCGPEFNINGIRVTSEFEGVNFIDATKITAGAVFEGPK